MIDNDPVSLACLYAPNDEISCKPFFKELNHGLKNMLKTKLTLYAQVILIAVLKIKIGQA